MERGLGLVVVKYICYSCCLMSEILYTLTLSFVVWSNLIYGNVDNILLINIVGCIVLAQWGNFPLCSSSVRIDYS